MCGAVLDALLPPRCAGCGAGAWPLCGRCADGVGVIVAPLCERCGRPTAEPMPSCRDCPPQGIEAVRAPFLYGGPLAAAVRGLKLSGWRALAPHLAGAMAEVCDLDAEAVTWVPLSRRRRARRGFDQAEVLARAVAPRLDLPVERLLRRVRHAAPQARRSGTARRSALATAFAATGPAPRSVLIIDDVLTTGATAAACATALRRAGARRVSVLVAARSLGGPVPARCWPAGARV